MLIPMGAKKVGHADCLRNVTWPAINGSNPWGNTQESQVARAVIRESSVVHLHLHSFSRRVRILTVCPHDMIVRLSCRVSD